MKPLRIPLTVNLKLDFMCITRHRVYLVEDIRNSDRCCWVILVFKVNLLKEYTGVKKIVSQRAQNCLIVL